MLLEAYFVVIIGKHSIIYTNPFPSGFITVYQPLFPAFCFSWKNTLMTQKISSTFNWFVFFPPGFMSILFILIIGHVSYVWSYMQIIAHVHTNNSQWREVGVLQILLLYGNRCMDQWLLIPIMKGGVSYILMGIEVTFCNNGQSPLHSFTFLLPLLFVQFLIK